MIDKNNFPLRLEGKTVIVEEIQPKYFPYVIEWRNNPELNKFLNQPYKLTPEIEKKWYEEKYLQDTTQALLIMLDKSRPDAPPLPFGTMGWTDFEINKKRVIGGRLLLGNHAYAHHPAFLESNFVIGDYIYSMVDIMYCHIVKKNKKALHFNEIMGYRPNTGEIQYPHELFVNGMEQVEYYRTKEMYLEVRKKIYERLSNAIFE